MTGFGIAGTSRMAARMAKAIRLSGLARTARISSGSSDRAAGFAAQHGIPAWGDLAAMLADPAVDAVYVAGRNGDHAATSIAALKAGKPVLCEKPFACSIAEAEAVIDAARQAGLPYMEAVATPFLPAVAEAVAQVRGGAWGAARHVEASFGYPVDPATEPGLFAADAGLLRDRAVYPLTLARIILGPVTAQDVETAGGTVHLRLAHAAGGGSDLAISFAEQLANRLVIDCDAARIMVPAPLLAAHRLSIGPAGPDRFLRIRQNPIVRRLDDIRAGWRGELRPFGASPYLPMLQHFCAMVREGRSESPILTHQTMLDVQRIIAGAGAPS